MLSLVLAVLEDLVLVDLDLTLFYSPIHLILCACLSLRRLLSCTGHLPSSLSRTLTLGHMRKCVGLGYVWNARRFKRCWYSTGSQEQSFDFRTVFESASLIGQFVSC